MEEQIEDLLLTLRAEGKFVKLSLEPKKGDTMIRKEAVNRMFINDGLFGKFNDVSEAFYDEMVDKYDSRY